MKRSRQPFKDSDDFDYTWNTARYASKVQKNESFSVEDYFEAKMPAGTEEQSPPSTSNAAKPCCDGDLDEAVSFLAHDTSLIQKTKTTA